MEKENKFIMMEQLIKENLSMENQMEKDNIVMLNLFINEISRMDKKMEMENIISLMPKYNFMTPTDLN
jgi:hypothetical protein